MFRKHHHFTVTNGGLYMYVVLILFQLLNLWITITLCLVYDVYMIVVGYTELINTNRYQLTSELYYIKKASIYPLN